MRSALRVALVALCVLGANPSRAQDWPTRALTMINPFAPGGPNDVPARLFAQRMGEILGQSVIVENVGGAGGMNGADRVAKAQPDGYTFLLGTVGTQAQNQTLYKKPAYDFDQGFRERRPVSGSTAGAGRAQGPSGQLDEGVRRLRQGECR